MEQLKKYLLKLKIKLLFELWYKLFLKFFIAGMIIMIVFAVISKWNYLCDSKLFFIIVLTVVLLCSFAMTYFKRITWQKTAEQADKLGYEERFITALELLEKNTVLNNMEQLAVKDAFQKANECELHKKYQLTLPKKQIQILVLLFAVLFGTSFITTTQQKEAERYSFAQLKKIEEVKKEIDREKEFDEDVLKAFDKEMDSITKNLKRAQTLEESKKLVEEAQQAIKALEKDSIPEDLKKTAEKLSQSEKTKELANALEQGDTQQINNQMDKLLSQMENMSQQELEQIAQAMNDMVKELSDEELKELLENLSEQLSKGNLAQANIKGQALKGKLATLSNQNKELIQNMENLNQALASENTTSKTEHSGQSGQLGEGQGQGQGEGEQSGMGQGGSGQGGGEGSNSGQGRGSGHQQTEKIYTRKAENMSGYSTQLQGQQNEQGQTNITREQTIGEIGQSVPYEQVYDSYRNNALRDIENSDVPYGMRELVSEYFSTLEQ